VDVPPPPGDGVAKPTTVPLGLTLRHVREAPRKGKENKENKDAPPRYHLCARFYGKVPAAADGSPLFAKANANANVHLTYGQAAWPLLNVFVNGSGLPLLPFNVSGAVVPLKA
jgi:hypothetical protein